MALARVNVYCLTWKQWESIGEVYAWDAVMGFVIWKSHSGFKMKNGWDVGQSEVSAN